MEKHVRLMFATAFVLFGMSLAVALASMAAYYDPAGGIRYGTVVTLDVILDGFKSAIRGALWQALTVHEWVLVACYLTGVSTFALTHNQKRSAARCAVFGAHLLALPWGWLGLGMLPDVFSGQIDGEWIAEHSPTMVAAGLWILCALAMVVVSWDRGWRRTKLGTASSGIS